MCDKNKWTKAEHYYAHFIAFILVGVFVFIITSMSSCTDSHLMQQIENQRILIEELQEIRK